jgi:membrane-associated phospholipid phosphatase
MKKVALFFLPTLFFAAVFMRWADHPVASFFASEPIREKYWQFFRTMTDIGLGENYFILSMSVYAFTRWAAPRLKSVRFDRRKIEFYRKWSAEFFICLLTAGIGVQFLKFLIGRARPLQTENFDPFVFSPFNTDHYFHSLPSGHAQVMFTAAPFFCLAFPRYRHLWYGIAWLVAFSRVVTFQHTMSDIVVGAYVGWSITTMTLMFLQRKPN